MLLTDIFRKIFFNSDVILNCIDVYKSLNNSKKILEYYFLKM